MQRFKSVYFADYPATSSKRRNLKLAFGPDDADLYGVLKPLSSEEKRPMRRGRASTPSAWHNCEKRTARATSRSFACYQQAPCMSA